MRASRCIARSQCRRCISSMTATSFALMLRPHREVTPSHIFLYQVQLAASSQRRLTGPQQSASPLAYFHTTPTSPSTPPSQSPRRIGKRRAPLLLATLGGVALVLYYALSQTDGSLATAAPLNRTTFTPYAVVAREDASATSFVLTLRPPPHSAARDPTTTTAPCCRGLWSVEVKQPQLQIARRYTPLPAPVGTEATGYDDGGEEDIRLLVRPVAGGEVSRYLAGLRPGRDRVELRGPHGGFDVAARLGEGVGDAGHVVFLAGGTGIAPALQVARRVLDGGGVGGQRTKPRVQILWANRRADDAEGLLDAVEDGGTRRGSRSWWSYLGSPGRGKEMKQPQAGRAVVATPSVIVRELNDLKERHGEHFNVCSFVDEQGSLVTEQCIRKAIQKYQSSKSDPMDTESCQLHSATLLVGMADEDPAGGQCECTGPGRPGRNLLFVSGPDGFIQAFAGAKAWHRGVERQGPVGGVIGNLNRNTLGLLKDWLVLKL